MSYLDSEAEAASLCKLIKSNVTEFEVLQAQLDALEAVEVGGTACTLGTEVNAVKRVEVIPLPDAKDMRSAGPSSVVRASPVVDIERTMAASFDFSAFNNDEWSANKSWDRMDKTNVDKMLLFRPATGSNYWRIWNNWLARSRSSR
jgi:hypothetical protein